jgi:hypothetical protein
MVMDGASGTVAAEERPESDLPAGERKRPRAGRRLRASDDSGMTAVEFVVLTPLMFIILMLTVQFAMYFFAKQAAQAAVQRGARIAREEAAHKGCAGGANQVDGVNWRTGQTWQFDAGNEVTQKATALGGRLFTIDPNGVTVDAAFATNGNVTVACPISTVDVQLTATPTSIVPFWQPKIHVQAGGPIEQGVVHK